MKTTLRYVLLFLAVAIVAGGPALAYSPWSSSTPKTTTTTILSAVSPGFGAGNGAAGTVAPAASWTVTGSGTLYNIADGHNSGVELRSYSSASSMGITALRASASLGASSQWSVQMTGRMMTGYATNSYPEMGVVVSTGISSGTAYTIAQYQSAGTPGYHVVTFTPGGARLSGAFNETVPTGIANAAVGLPVYMRALNDGTVLHYQVSGNGSDYNDWYSIASPSSLTDYGFFAGDEFSGGSSYALAMVYELNLATSLTSCSVTGATVATPSVISCAMNLLDGDLVSCHGIGGTTADNNAAPPNNNNAGVWMAHVTSAGAAFSIFSQSSGTWVAVTGNSAFTSGGTCTLVSR